MSRSYRVISADAHLQVAPERWTPRVPAGYRDRAPRTIRLHTGTDAELVEGQGLKICLGGLSGGPYEQRSPLGGTYDASPGLGSPQQRLREQDLDGVDAEVLFSGSAGINDWRGIKDDAAYRAVIHAYNEFLAEEYCPVAPDRLIGLGLIPDTGVEDALEEMEYCARSGLKGVCLNMYPSGRGYPTPEDDRFWAAALDTNVALTVHVSFGGFRGTGPAYRYKRDPAEVASGVDVFSKFAKYAFRGGLNATPMRKPTGRIRGGPSTRCSPWYRTTKRT